MIELCKNHASQFIIIDMVIGFENSNLLVNEDAGNVSACVRIKQPSGASDRIPNTVFRVRIATVSNGKMIIFV